MKGSVSILLTVCLCVLAGVETFSQRFETLNSRYAIDAVRTLFQDSYGFIWIGTNNGLLKYDGYNFTSFRPDPQDSLALKGPRVTAVGEDQKDRVWLGLTNYGLQYYDRNTRLFHSVNLIDAAGQPISRISVRAISLRNDTLWAGTDQGLFCVSTEDTTVQKRFVHNREDPYSLSSNSILNLYCPDTGDVWVATQNGINRLNVITEQFTNFRSRPGYPAGQIPCVDQSPSGTLWVSTREAPYRLYQWAAADDVFIPDSLFIASGNAWGDFRFDITDEGELWLSVRGMGAVRYRPSTGDYVIYDPTKGRHHGFRSYYNYQALVDRFGNFWSGGDVLHMWPRSNKAIQSISSDGYPVHSVYSNDEQIWLSTTQPVRWRFATLQTEVFWPSTLPTTPNPQYERVVDFSRIYQFRQYQGNTIAFVTTRSFFLWDLSNDRYREYPLALGGPMRDFVLGDDNDVWLTTNQGTPAHLDLQSGKFYRLNTVGIHSLQNTVSVVRDSNVVWWGSTSHGLARMDLETMDIHVYPCSAEKTDTALYGYVVHDIALHSSGLVWISTELGLNALDPLTGRFQQYGVDHGLPNNVIASILEAESGKLWFGTLAGLVRFDPVDGSVRHFTSDDGLINNSYLPRSAFRSPSGMLYFGGDQGVDFFHPRQMGSNPIAPLLYVDQVKVNNAILESPATLGAPTHLSLGHHENFIDIQFLGLHLTSPLNNTYAYKLNDGDWIDLGKARTVTLANLSPGTYTITAKTANADGIWSDENELLKLTIHPPWWRTSLFYIATALLAGVSIYLIYARRVRSIRQIERERAHFNQQIAEMEMKALRAQMNPHFIFNSLNSVQSLIAKKDLPSAKYYLSQFSNLIRNVLKNSRQKFVKLQDDLDTLSSYLELERFRFKNFQYMIRVAEDVDTDFIEIPPLLIQPYVENAIWHGLKHKPAGDGRIEISVSREGDLVKIRIEDNGIGRKQAKKLQTRSRSKQESLGMQITSDRLNLLQALYGHEARLEILDLENPTGTVVLIDLPIPA